MKNKLLSFIDLLIFFFNQGYSLQETLDFCSLLNYEKEVKEIKNYLNQGLSLDEIFIMLPFPTLFKEYYSFFKNEFTLETALKKSIEIAKKTGYAIAIGHPHDITIKVLRESKHLLKDVEPIYVNQLPYLK